jgi:uncharacterized protein YcaQ
VEYSRPLLSTAPLVPNRAFRRALLSLNGLSAPLPQDALPAPTAARGPAWVAGMVERLGFVQVDSVSAVERAQHHILFSRNRHYTHEWLSSCLEEQRSLFENWTHDAAILPSGSYPYWRHYFERFERYEIHNGYRRYFETVSDEQMEHVLKRIRQEGPLKPRDFAPDKVAIGWGGGPEEKSFPVPTVAKVAMEYLWRTGTLAVTRRDKREKVYDLSERVLSPEHLEGRVSWDEYLDWSCRSALRRLGAATPAQIARFFHAVSTAEASRWCEERMGTDLIRVDVELADRTRTRAAVYALEKDVERLLSAPGAPRRLRLLNPFDPLIHDRQRTSKVFGFDYVLEIFVPPKKRKFGYYVLPILEGERFTGRVEVKADRKAGTLNVIGLFWEPGLRPSAQRAPQLELELARLAKFCGVDEVLGA